MALTETAFFFGHEHPLMGIYSSADGRQSSDTGVVILNSGLVHRCGPYRMGVEIARALADAGIPAMRFDQSARGDSARRSGASVEESAALDIAMAIDALRNQVACQKVVLLGLCSGADDIVRYAEQATDLAGMILLDPYAAKTPRYKIRHLWPRISSPKRVFRHVVRLMRGQATMRSAPKVVDNLGNIRAFPGHAQAVRAFSQVCDGGAALCVFTSGVSDYYNYRGQLVEGLGLKNQSENLEEVFFESAQHTYPLNFQRRQLVDVIVDFCARRFGSGDSVN